MTHFATDNIHWREVARDHRPRGPKITDQQVMRSIVEGIGSKRVGMDAVHQASQVNRDRARELLRRLMIAGLVKVEHPSAGPVLHGSFRLATASALYYLSGPVEGVVMPELNNNPTRRTT